MIIFKGIKYSLTIPVLTTMLFFVVSAHAQVTFIIHDLPKGTPPDDSIFICGTFNNWSTDPKFLLHKRLDGKYSITLPIDSSFQYKFHRGDWARVETSSRNQYMANRQYAPAEGAVIDVYIANWQDLGGAKPFEIVSFLFFALVFVSLSAAYLLMQIRNKKKPRTAAVTTFLVFLAVVLLGRVVIEVVTLPWQFQVGLIGDVCLMIAGPLWYFALCSVTQKDTPGLIHFIPAAFFILLFVIRFFNPPGLSFLTEPAMNDFVTWDDLIIYAASSLSLIGYLISGLRLVTARDAKKDLQSVEKKFLKSLVVFGGVFTAVAILKIYVFTGHKESTLMWYNRNLLIGGASVLTLVVCYFVFTFEELFRSSQAVLRKNDDLNSMKLLLHKSMKEEQRFKDPHLTLNDLSDAVNIKPHILSKVINDCFRQNFRDFVNKYRIEEFIELANREEGKRFTFLALAFEVGFNSKSTFNVAFKKTMGVTPREYFMGRKGKPLKDNAIDSTIL